MTVKRGGSMTNLQRIIDENGVQQRWLAEAVGVTEVSMSRYVSGERIPKAPIAIRMADALGVNVKDLYGWESEKRTHERTETHACDCISRQDAIDAVENIDCSDGVGISALKCEAVDDGVTAIKALPSAHPKIIRCRDCRHFEYDHPYIIQGVPVLGHEVCNAWGDGCKADENGFCFLAERRTDEID